MAEQASLMTEAQKKVYDLILGTRLFIGAHYLREYPDVKDAGMDPLEHFVIIGDAEGRTPNPFFNPNWYRSQIGIALGGSNTLLHYSMVGDKQNIQPIIGLDPEYVKQQVPNRKETALHSFIGAKSFGAILNPNPLFDYRFYLTQYPDIVGSELDPYIHFIYYGAQEGRVPSNGFSWGYIKERFNLSGSNDEVFKKLMLNWRRLDWSKVQGESSVVLVQQEVRENHRPAPQFEPQLKLLDRAQKIDVEFYAFYLPQFHQIPENNEWWGTGFTEWHNVVRGMPRFRSHYQPRIPSDLGFYDLADGAVLEKQVAMAKQGGLDGFGFYYYNFGQKRLLEKPLEAFRDNKNLDFGYFLIWANESWSRRWDGSEKEVLLEQTYPKELVANLADDFVSYLADPRYKKIDGRQLLVIYRVSELPEPVKFVKSLRSALGKKGFDPLIYMAQTFEDDDYKQYGLDGAIEFPPHKLSRKMQPITPERVYERSPDLRVYSYDQFVERAKAEKTSDHQIRTCFPSWDNDGRRQGASSVVHGSTPEKFSTWLRYLVEEAKQNPNAPKLVCINAWNEWGEGAYLEPDRRYGHAYLNALERVKFPEFEPQYKKVVLVGHDAFPAGAQRLLLSIGRTLKTTFNMDIQYVLLRADAGYDGLLEEYKATAPTHVVNADSRGDLQKIAQQLQADGYRHVICNTSVSVVAGIVFAAPDWTSILLVHELNKMLDDLKLKPVIKQVSKSFKKIIAPSTEIAKLLGNVAGKKPIDIPVIPQGKYKQLREIDVKKNLAAFLDYLGIKRKPKVVVGIGYADHRKGADLFIQACAQMSQADPETVFIWQGDWDPQAREEFDEQINELLESANLILVPNNESIEEVLNVADAFFLSSREDPLPTVAFEAWSLGVPVVAFAGAGGISSLIAKNRKLGEIASTVSARSACMMLEKVLSNKSVQGAQYRQSWVAQECNWPAYVYKIIQILFDLPSVDVDLIGHNHGKYAQEAIDSVLAQSLPAARLTYFDVASTDKSKIEITSAVKQTAERVDFIELPPNSGKLYKTWYEIAKQSSAEFIYFLEADDSVSQHFLEQGVNLLRGNPKAGLVFSDVSWVNEQGEIITPSHSKYIMETFGLDILSSAKISPEQALNSDFMVRNGILSVSSVIFRRSVLLKALERAKNDLNKVGFAYDWVLYSAIAKLGFGFIYFPGQVVKHRQHLQSMSKKKNHSNELMTIYKLNPASKELESKRKRYVLELKK